MAAPAPAQDLPLSEHVKHAEIRAHGRTVVVAIDGSEQSQRLLEWTAAGFVKDGDRVNVVTAYDSVSHSVDVGDDSVLGAVSLTELDEQLEKLARLEASQLLQTAARTLKTKHGLEATLILKRGPAKYVLTEFVGHESPDVLLVASHGAGAVGHLVLGSTCDYLVHHANCPVVVYKEKQYAHALDSIADA